jgi:hypothetical protein
MRFKSIVLGLSIAILTVTSGYAQDWRKSPLTSTTSNYWRNMPYTGKTSDNWRNSSFSGRQIESKLRWNKGRWQNSLINWRNNPYIKRPKKWNSWQNRWDKRKWRYSPLNWRNSELRYKNTIKRYESRSVVQEVKEWVAPDREADKESIRKLSKHAV